MRIDTDNMKHLIACAVVAFVVAAIEALLGCAYILSCLAGFIAGIAIGVGKEYGDHCAPGNRWSWGDILMDSIGSLIGALIGSLFSLLG